jgi:hypothetical protein
VPQPLQQPLTLFFVLQVELLQQSVSLLYMYLNRCNSRWAEERLQHWAAPPVVGCAEEQMWTRSDQHEVYKADAIRKIRLGKVCRTGRGC